MNIGYVYKRLPQDEIGISLVGLLISLLIASILMAGVFTAVDVASKNNMESIKINLRIAQIEAMKAALDASVSNATAKPNVSTNGLSFTYQMTNTTNLIAPVSCTGSIILSGDSMNYTINTIKGGKACLSTNQESAATSYPVGTGWSFGKTITVGCMGNISTESSGLRSGEMLTAILQSEDGMPAKEILICLPNL